MPATEWEQPLGSTASGQTVHPTWKWRPKVGESYFIIRETPGTKEMKLSKEKKIVEHLLRSRCFGYFHSCYLFEISP